MAMFQSSARPRAGCNVKAAQLRLDAAKFQSSARPRAGCNASSTTGQVRRRFQSSARPRAGCNVVVDVREAQRVVSILSPPEGRLQPGVARTWTMIGAFQSSARPRAGCNYRRARVRSVRLGFNPQPARGQAATSSGPGRRSRPCVSILSPPEGRLQPRPSDGRTRSPEFQSSARPRAGCNATSIYNIPDGYEFQSSARPRAGCNRRPEGTPRPDHRFNPQPARGQAATTPPS